MDRVAVQTDVSFAEPEYNESVVEQTKISENKQDGPDLP